MSNEVPGGGSRRRAGMPRWFKFSLLVVAAVVLVMVAVFVASGGSHGPARHTGGLARAGAVGPAVP